MNKCFRLINIWLHIVVSSFNEVVFSIIVLFICSLVSNGYPFTGGSEVIHIVSTKSTNAKKTVNQHYLVVVTQIYIREDLTKFLNYHKGAVATQQAGWNSDQNTPYHLSIQINSRSISGK